MAQPEGVEQDLPVQSCDYRTGVLPRTETDAWRQIKGYCTVGDLQQQQSRRAAIFKYIFVVPDGTAVSTHPKWNTYSKRFSSKKRKLSNENSASGLLSLAAVAATQTAEPIPKPHILEPAPAEVNQPQRDGQEKVHDSAEEDQLSTDQGVEEEGLYQKYFLGRKETLDACRRNSEYPPCSNRRESQYRKRPGSLMKPRLNGFLQHPVQNHDYLPAETETVPVLDKARKHDFARNGQGFSIVNLCESEHGNGVDGGRGGDLFHGAADARLAWDRFRTKQKNTGQPLFLDHYDAGNECKQYLGKIAGCTSHSGHAGSTLAGDPAIIIDESGLRFDPGRVTASAKSDADLNTAAAFLHQKVLARMPPQFDHPKYAPSRTYREDHASALATMAKALRQGFHVDTYIEGFSALVAVESDFRVIVFKNSLALIRRVAELWKIYDEGGRHSPQGVDVGDWWDFCCWRQLQKEGWGSTCFLEPRTLVVPRGHALIFSTWLLHAGAEWEQGDFSGYNRIHFYLTPFLIESSMQSVRMQDRAPNPSSGLGSFSPALHFFPLPPQPGSSAPLLPKWITREVDDKQKILRSNKEKGGRGKPGREL